MGSKQNKICHFSDDDDNDSIDSNHSNECEEIKMSAAAEKNRDSDTLDLQCNIDSCPRSPERNSDELHFGLNCNSLHTYRLIGFGSVDSQTVETEDLCLNIDVGIAPDSILGNDNTSNQTDGNIELADHDVEAVKEIIDKVFVEEIESKNMTIDVNSSNFAPDILTDEEIAAIVLPSFQRHDEQQRSPGAYRVHSSGLVRVDTARGRDIESTNTSRGVSGGVSEQDIVISTHSCLSILDSVNVSPRSIHDTLEQETSASSTERDLESEVIISAVLVDENQVPQDNAISSGINDAVSVFYVPSSLSSLEIVKSVHNGNQAILVKATRINLKRRKLQIFLFIAFIVCLSSLGWIKTDRGHEVNNGGNENNEGNENNGGNENSDISKSNSSTIANSKSFYPTISPSYDPREDLLVAAHSLVWGYTGYVGNTSLCNDSYEFLPTKELSLKCGGGIMEVEVVVVDSLVIAN